MKLSQWLEKSGLSKAAFAEFVGISRQALHSILNGKSKPALETALAIERETKGAIKVKDWFK